MLEKKKKSYVNPAGLYVRVAEVLSTIELLSSLRPSRGGAPVAIEGGQVGPWCPDLLQLASGGSLWHVLRGPASYP